MRVFAPDGIPMMGVDFTNFDASILSPNLPAHVQSTVSIQFPVTMEGVYWFNVFYKGKSLGGGDLVIEYRDTKEKTGGTDTYI